MALSGNGIRYDCVPNYWDGVAGSGYATLVYQTYQAVAATGGSGHWQRFFNGSDITLIQCAEQLQKPVLAVEQTYTTCTWQNVILDAAVRVAGAEREAW